jgi:hypothetical protein
MAQGSSPLDSTISLVDSVAKGGYIADVRSKALVELEALRARITADMQAMQLLAEGPVDEDEAAEKKRLGKVLFDAKDELNAIRSKLLAASAELKM